MIDVTVIFIYLLVVMAQRYVQAARDVHHLSLIEQGRCVIGDCIYASDCTGL